jgi:ribonuclease P protein subunit POP4
MSYNNKNIVLHELIGLDAEVINCSDNSQIGIKGRVIDETKNLLLVKSGDMTRKIVKKNCVFRFRHDGQSFVVNGEEIDFRPHERIEKGMKYYKKRKM